MLALPVGAVSACCVGCWRSIFRKPTNRTDAVFGSAFISSTRKPRNALRLDAMTLSPMGQAVLRLATNCLRFCFGQYSFHCRGARFRAQLGLPG